MQEPREGLIPGQMQRMLVLLFTVVAVLLYAAVLISAMLVSITREEPNFNHNMERAAGLLSGLVGAVVTAGFARSRRPSGSPVRTSHPLGGESLTTWRRLVPPSRTSRNLASLGDMLGLGDLPSELARVPEPLPEEGGAPPTPEPLPPPGMTLKMWVALVYVAIYFVVGLAAFVVSIWHRSAPEVVSSSAWVWLGTVISAAYSFFGLDSDG